jgi:hypothetical protein
MYPDCIVRVEDFAFISGIKSMPSGFLDGNPCVNLPPEAIRSCNTRTESWAMIRGRGRET